MKILGNIQTGDCVMVTNGEPRPPEHHSKKLRTWKFSNYTGWVYRIEPNGTYCISEKKGGILVKCYRPEGNSKLTITKIEEFTTL